jgi:CHAT domain-containing protein
MNRRLTNVGFCVFAGALLVVCALKLGPHTKLNIWRTSSEKANEVQSNDPQRLLSEADRLALLGNWAKARPLFARAEQIYIARGDERNALYARIGKLRNDVEGSSYADASRYLDEQLRRPIVQNDLRLKLRCLTVKGIIDLNTNSSAARRDWSDALKIAQSLGDGIWISRATGQLGILTFMEGKIAEAAKMVMRAIFSAVLHHDVDGEITFLTYFGYGLNEYNRPQQALYLFDKALKIAEANPDAGFPIRVYIGKVTALWKLNRRQQAEALLEHTLEEARRTNTLGAEANLLLEAGEMAEEGNNPRRALAYYEQSAKVASIASLPRIISEANFRLANLYRGSDLTEAVRCIETGVQAAREVEATYWLPHYLAIEAELKEASGQLQEADDLFSEAADQVEGLLVNVSSPMDESSLIGTMSDIYLGHFRLAINSLKDAGKAFQIVEQARGRAMADALHSKQNTGAASVNLTPAEIEIVSLQRELRKPHTSEERNQMLEKLYDAEARLKDVEYEQYHFRKFFPAKPVDLQTLRHSLNGDEMILEYVLADPASFCLTISERSVRPVRLAGRSQIERLIDEYATEVKGKKSGDELAKQLYLSLVGPVLEKQKEKRLIIVPDGKLNALPFDSLRNSSDKYLVQSHVISYTPSSTVFYLLRSQAHRARARLPFLGVGYDREALVIATNDGPYRTRAGNILRGLFDLQNGTLVPLPYAGEEVRSVASLIGPRSIVLLGPAATEANLKAQPLGDFDVLHFAVHSISNPAEPERSALVLRTDPQSSEDGVWQAREIRRVLLNAELVTLSGCDTGTGKTEGEEGVQNLVRAFIMAGAKSVVSSVWPVDDRFTATLMTKFYWNLAGSADKATALTQAKLDILHEFGVNTVPYYWAGFGITGDGNGQIPFSTYK